MDKNELVFASGNAGKLREVATLLQPLGYRVRPQKDFAVDEVPETGATFVENALIKARHAARATGRPALADDSGLCATALDGAPGIRSARFAGESASDDDNIERLLAEMCDRSDRSAWFHCALVLLHGPEDPAPLIGQGRWPGTLLTVRAGSGGFGYDPVFLPEGLDRSAAEMTPDEKNTVSHRARALAALAAELRAPTE